MTLEEAKRSIVTVGAGRGFVIKSGHYRYVITTAHCLPFLPPAHAAAYDHEKIYAKLLGPLATEPTVWTECVFVDPVADIAVLGSVDGQEFCDEANAYDRLTNDDLDEGGSEEGCPALPMADAPEQARAWMLSLDGQWFECEARRVRGPRAALVVEKAAATIAAGMSGSPILDDDGAAIGVVCLNAGSWPNPRLAAHLPAWLAREVRA
jgi:hypothetical protein